MEDIKNFLKKMNEETYQIVEEEESKNLAKEDTLTLIAEFVKDVKKRFAKSADRMEILKLAAKTLDFYIENIETDEDEVEVGFENPMSVDIDSTEEEPVSDLE